MSLSKFNLYFFFQAEDGIRDVAVTGVQTCALPIFDRSSILKAKASAAVNVTASSLSQVYDGLPKAVTVSTNPPGLSTTLQVDKSTPLVSWSKPNAITYGTRLNMAQLNATGSVPGTFSYNPSIGTVVAAGTQNLSLTFVPADSTDYNVVNSAVQISVLPAPLHVTANSVSRFYGSANPPLTGAVAGVVNGDNLSATFSTNATTDAPPGKYPITAVINDANHRLPNYQLDVVNGTLTVLPAPVISLTKTRFDFGARNLFSTSEDFTLTVGNLGTADMIITAVSLGGMNARDFVPANNCNNAVAPGGACAITLTFTPSALGSRSAVLTLTDNTSGFPGSQQTVAFSGNGL